MAEKKVYSRRLNKASEVVTRPNDFGDLDKIDQHIEQHVSTDALDRAVCECSKCPPELANKLRKGRRLGKHSLMKLAEISRRAVFDIETLNGYIVNEQFDIHPTAGAGYRVAATVLPWTLAEKKTRQYLCVYVHRSSADLKCKLRVARLDVDGDVRTILVTDHVCDRLSERAHIRGSQVAYIAQSILRAGLKTWKQRDKKERLLEIVDFDGNLLGYCPVIGKRVGLHGERRTLVDDVKRCIQDQDRWRLKTFEPPEWVEKYIVPDED